MLQPIARPRNKSTFDLADAVVVMLFAMSNLYAASLPLHMNQRRPMPPAVQTRRDQYAIQIMMYAKQRMRKMKMMATTIVAPRMIARADQEV
jgi:hypothetical protein